MSVDTTGPGPLVLVRNSGEFGGGITIETFGTAGSGVGLFASVAVGTAVHGMCQGVGIGVKAQCRGGAALVATTDNGNVIEGRRRDPRRGVEELVFVVRPNGAVLADGPFGGPADFAEMLPVAGPATSYQAGECS